MIKYQYKLRKGGTGYNTEIEGRENSIQKGAKSKLQKSLPRKITD